jgi:hypothetical protein
MIDISVQSSGWPTQQDLDDLAEYTVKEVARKIFETAVQLSPVYTGSFRASWRLSFNEPDLSVTNWPIPDLPIGGAKFEWPSGFKLGDTVVISNNQPYAERLEYEGWSRQAPLGVLRLAVAAAELMST